MSQTPGNGSALPLPNTHARGGRGALSGEQQRVYDILAEMKPEIAAMYEACLLVLDRVEHDERLPLAAHAAREAMSAIGEVYMRWDKKRLKSELDKLTKKFRSLPPDLLLGGVIPEATTPDKSLVKFLQEFQDFARWYGNDVGTRREQAANLFKQILPREKPALYQSLAEIWVEVFDFFSSVCHHGRRATREEFVVELSRFQDCVLATRRPKAVADLDAIDGLIAEVQANGLS